MPPKKRHKRVGSAFDMDEPDNWEVVAVTELLAVDPGATNNGLALFANDSPVRGPDWACLQAWKAKSARDCLEYVHSWLLKRVRGVLVVEGFELFPTMMQQQGYSRFGVVEVIGAIKWEYLTSIASHRDHLLGYKAFCEQGASIKAHGRKYMAKIGVEETGPNQHARDAEAHGWYRIRRLRGD